MEKLHNYNSNNSVKKKLDLRPISATNTQNEDQNKSVNMMEVLTPAKQSSILPKINQNSTRVISSKKELSKVSGEFNDSYMQASTSSLKSDIVKSKNSTNTQRFNQQKFVTNSNISNNINTNFKKPENKELAKLTSKPFQTGKGSYIKSAKANLNKSNLAQESLQYQSTQVPQDSVLTQSQETKQIMEGKFYQSGQSNFDRYAYESSQEKKNNSINNIFIDEDGQQIQNISNFRMDDDQSDYDSDEEEKYDVGQYESSYSNLQELQQRFEAYDQQKALQIEEYQDYIAQLTSKVDSNGEQLVSFPSDYEQSFMRSFQNFRQARNTIQDSSQITELYDDFNLQNRMRESQLPLHDNQHLKEELKKIDQLDKQLQRKEKELKELERNNVDNKSNNNSIKEDDNKSETTNQNNSSMMSSLDQSQAFITELLRRKSARKDSNLQKKQKKTPSNNQQSNGLYITLNRNYYFLKRDESLCDKLDEEQQKRLENLMSDISKNYDKNGNKKDNNKEIQEKVFQIDEQRIKSVDERLSQVKKQIYVNDDDPEVEKKTNKRGDKVIQQVIEEKELIKKQSEVNKKMHELYKNPDELAPQDQIKKLVKDLQKNALNQQRSNPQLPEEMLEYMEIIKKTNEEANQFMQQIDVNYMENMANEFQQMKQQIESSQQNIKEYYTKIEQNKELKELQQKQEQNDNQELRQKMNNMYQDMIKKLYEEQQQVNKFFENAVSLEEKLKDQLENEMEFLQAEPFQSAIDPELQQLIEKNVEKKARDYDDEFTQKVKAANPELFQNYDEADEEYIDNITQIDESLNNSRAQSMQSLNNSQFMTNGQMMSHQEENFSQISKLIDKIQENGQMTLLTQDDQSEVSIQIQNTQNDNQLRDDQLRQLSQQINNDEEMDLEDSLEI